MADPIAGTRVFLVEDETLIAMLIEDMIAQIDCVRDGAAASVPQALAMLERRRPDVAVLDVNVDGQQVYPVCERLEELGIPFLFSTGYGEPGVPPRWRESPVLQKPYDAAQLAAAIALCRERRRAPRGPQG